jgi:predicted permease
MASRKPFEAGLDRELQYHFERMVRESIESGMDPEEARRRARLEFGGMEQIKEDCRDVRGRWLEDFVKDLRYAGRTLRRSPGFLAVAVLSLALGIGANTAIFSLINAIMLRSLPVKEPNRLVQVARIGQSGTPSYVSYPLFQFFREHMKTLASSAVQLEGSPAIVIDGAEEIVSAEQVSGEHFSVFGLEPAAGRLLEPSDDLDSATSPAAVIGYRYWQRRFGLDPAAVGKTFTLQFNNRIFTIVGVTPRRYQGARLGMEPDITLPLSQILPADRRREPTLNLFNMVGRLAPGATIAQATAEVQVVWKAFQQPIAAAMPEKDRPRYLQTSAVVLPGAGGISELRGEYDTYAAALLVLMGIVALVLLLACANLSGLLLARAASREREIAIRLAIGAAGSRLMRQFLTESLVLAVLGGSAGLLLAGWFSAVLLAMMGGNRPFLLSTAPDWRVLGFTAAISLTACILAGLAPGLHALRANLNPGLQRARSGGRQRLGRALVVAQLAISMVLVVGAALFIDTLARLYTTDRGVNTDGVLIFRLRSNERYRGDRAWATAGQLVERLNELPGVASATVADVVPLSGSEWNRNVQVEGYRFRPDESEDSLFNVVGPRFFATVGTPLVMGREFDRRDTIDAPKVAIVNESFVRYFFAGGPALGRHVTSLNATYEIVGVVKDAKYQALRRGFAKTMYIPVMQRVGDQPNAYYFMARVRAGDPMRLAPALDSVVREVDPGMRVRLVETYSEMVDYTMLTERIMAMLGGFFGLLALAVACLGIFGSMAFQVSRRSNEIGLRMALGANRTTIVALVLREVAVLLVAGCLLGAAAAIPLTGLTRKLLFGIRPTEPSIFLVASLLLGLAALAAGWIPARRAALVDPMIALRHE